MERKVAEFLRMLKDMKNLNGLGKVAGLAALGIGLWLLIEYLRRT